MRIERNQRTDLPEGVSREMRMWRRGFGSMPTSYIEFHKGLAQARLQALASIYGFVVVNTKVQSDGWMDGMRVLTAIIETKSERLLKLQWHDGNQDFMKRSEAGGWTLISQKDLQ